MNFEFCCGASRFASCSTKFKIQDTAPSTTKPRWPPRLVRWISSQGLEVASGRAKGSQGRKGSSPPRGSTPPFGVSRAEDDRVDRVARLSAAIVAHEDLSPRYRVRFVRQRIRMESQPDGGSSRAADFQTRETVPRGQGDRLTVTPQWLGRPKPGRLRKCPRGVAS